MSVRLFVLGCSGSGKSTAARYIAMLARDRGWSADFINDYGILYEMFHADSKHEKFRLAAHNGFDVLDMSVYDTALDELTRQAQNLTVKAGENELVIVEFARCDYREAMKHFDEHFLRTAHFLFLDAEINTCKQRVLERIAQPQSLDDHFVSTKIFKRYYRKDNSTYMKSNLKREFEIDENRIKIIDNTSTLKDFHIKMWELAETILEQETYILHETEPLQALASLVSDDAHDNVTMQIQAPDRENL